MRRLSLITLIFLGALVTQAAPPDCTKFITADDGQFADKYIGLLQDGKNEEALAVSSPLMKS